MWQSVVALPQPVGPSSKQITKPKLLGATSNLFLSISKEPQLLQQTCSSGCPFTHAHRNILLWLSRISSISICAPLLTSCLVHYREEPGCIFFPPSHQIIYTCSPVPPLPQVEQFQLTQPLFICQVLQSLHHLWGPLLIPLKDPYSHLGLGCPKQDGEDVSKKHILQEMLSSHFRLISRMTSYIFNKKEHFQTNQVFKLIHWA